MPAAKPVDRRQRRNSTALELIAGRALPVVPPAPAGLLPEVVQMWMAYWHSEMAQLVTLATDLPGLNRLFRYYDDMERAWVIYRATPEVKGSTGQTQISHFAKHIREIEPLVARLEDRYGLSPRSRLELGVTFGDAARSLEDLYREAVHDDTIDPALFVIEANGAVSPAKVRKPKAARRQVVRSARRVVDRG